MFATSRNTRCSWSRLAPMRSPGGASPASQSREHPRYFSTDFPFDPISTDAEYALPGTSPDVIDIAKANRPGLLVFPLHSPGVLGFGLLRPSQGRLSFINKRHGDAITPQTNALDRTIDFLADTARNEGLLVSRLRATTWI